jgi:pilus assembly protein CpaB
MQQPQAMPVHPAFTSKKILLLAIILGVVAAGLAVAFLSNRAGSPSIAAPVATVEVVVAKQDIPAGTKITDSMVELKGIPENAVVTQPLTTLADASGHVARYPVQKGAQLSTSSIVAPAPKTALSFQIPAGKRAVTIHVTTDNSPAALMVPGDFVDVLSVGTVDDIAGAPGATLATGKSTENPPKVAVTLVQDVQVLAIQSTYVDDGVPYSPSVRGDTPKDNNAVTNVTLALTPEQAQLVFLASQGGTLTVTLRAFGDEDAATVPPVVEPIPLPTVAP